MRRDEPWWFFAIGIMMMLAMAAFLLFDTPIQP